MQLINILNLPAKYRNRYDKIKNIVIKDLKKEIKDNYLIFEATTSNGYRTMIAFKPNEKIRSDSKIKVYCSCKSFEFEFAETIDRNNSLLILKNRPDRVSNKIGILTGCKHLIFLGRYIFERRNILDMEV